MRFETIVDFYLITKLTCYVLESRDPQTIIRNSQERCERLAKAKPNSYMMVIMWSNDAISDLGLSGNYNKTRILSGGTSFITPEHLKRAQKSIVNYLTKNSRMINWDHNLIWQLKVYVQRFQQLNNLCRTYEKIKGRLHRIKNSGLLCNFLELRNRTYEKITMSGWQKLKS
ncbi:unnamed protein product [Rhizophagus irregularis]|uniref:Uncharacterized protein n=1 Tax=Rhizophagus irregularis TaxID=588596 RepID=A0A916E299_9GLOM|nr:unnamed protein product [Rhizophagus irregularis]